MKRREQTLFILGFLGPPVVLYALLVLLPAVNAFRYALTRWDGLSQPVWIGLQNFGSILKQGSDFLPAIQHNIYLMVVPGAIILSLALFFAYVIHQRVRGARLFRIAFFFPNVISSVAVALLWVLIYSSTQVGMLNHLLGMEWHGGSIAKWLGLKVPVMFTDKSMLLKSLVPMIVWSATGFYMVLFLASMENIPESYYEAARLDGATPFRLFWHVTLPLMWDVLTTGIIFLVIGGLKIFDWIWVMENGRPTGATHTMATLMYSKVFEEYNIGYGTAIAVVLFLMVLLATMVSFRLLRRERLEY